MKNFTLLAAFAVLAAASCSKKSLVPDALSCEGGAQANQETVTIPFTYSSRGYDVTKASPEYEEESRINWIDVYVKVDDGDYSKYRILPDALPELTVPKGETYRMLALANGNLDANPLPTRVVDGIRQFYGACYKLSDNTFGSFVMDAGAEIVTDGTTPVHFDFVRRLNKVTINKVKNIYASATSFKIDEIYISNVSDEYHVHGATACSVAHYNVDGYESSALDHLIYASVDKELPYAEEVSLGESLYFRNDNTLPKYLVVNATADGQKMSYSCLLEGSESGNDHIVYNIIFSHLGDTSMTPGSVLPGEKADFSYDSDVTVWNDSELNLYY